jgi:hypothetical protein
MEIKHTCKRLRESASPYDCQEALEAGIAHGRREEHQRACKMIRLALGEIANARFPVIAPFIQERVEQVENFTALHQFMLVVSTAWSPEDVLRFILALDDAQGNTR